MCTMRLQRENVRQFLGCSPKRLTDQRGVHVLHLLDIVFYPCVYLRGHTAGYGGNGLIVTLFRPIRRKRRAAGRKLCPCLRRAEHDHDTIGLGERAARARRRAEFPSQALTRRPSTIMSHSRPLGENKMRCEHLLVASTVPCRALFRGVRRDGFFSAARTTQTSGNADTRFVMPFAMPRDFPCSTLVTTSIFYLPLPLSLSASLFVSHSPDSRLNSVPPSLLSISTHETNVADADDSVVGCRGHTVSFPAGGMGLTLTKEPAGGCSVTKLVSGGVAQTHGVVLGQWVCGEARVDRTCSHLKVSRHVSPSMFLSGLRNPSSWIRFKHSLFSAAITPRQDHATHHYFTFIVSTCVFRHAIVFKCYAHGEV